MKVVIFLAPFFFAACGGGATAPTVKPGVDCDTVARCEAPTSVNARLCPYRLTDQLCGDFFSAFIQCQYGDCGADARIDFDASVGRCALEQAAWIDCPFTRARDGGGP